MNFVIGFTFSKGPGPGKLYKVCRKKVMCYKGLSTDLMQNELNPAWPPGETISQKLTQLREHWIVKDKRRYRWKLFQS